MVKKFLIIYNLHFKSSDNSLLKKLDINLLIFFYVWNHWEKCSATWFDFHPLFQLRVVKLASASAGTVVKDLWKLCKCKVKVQERFKYSAILFGMLPKILRLVTCLVYFVLHANLNKICHLALLLYSLKLSISKLLENSYSGSLIWSIVRSFF